MTPVTYFDISMEAIERFFFELYFLRLKGFAKQVFTALLVAGVVCYFFGSCSELPRTKVPAGGELHFHLLKGGDVKQVVGAHLSKVFFCFFS